MPLYFFVFYKTALLTRNESNSQTNIYNSDNAKKIIWFFIVLIYINNTYIDDASLKNGLEIFPSQTLIPV